MPKNKIPLAEARIQGNLKDLEQVYQVNYMPEDIIKEVHYDDKIELMIGLQKDGQQVYAYRSLRFTNPIQLKGLIISLTKAFFMFSKQRKTINPKNYRGQITIFFKDMEEALGSNNGGRKNVTNNY